MIWGAAGNIACYGPVLAERANVVIELFVIYIADYLLYSGSFWYSSKIHSIIFLKKFLHTPVILLQRITKVSGHMIYVLIDVLCRGWKWNWAVDEY